MESGSMSERWHGSACEAAVPGEWWLADGVGLSEDAKREQGELGLRVILPGRKSHSHPALRPGWLIELAPNRPARRALRLVWAWGW